jgi:hypothetical protein
MRSKRYDTLPLKTQLLTTSTNMTIFTLLFIFLEKKKKNHKAN